MVKEKLFKPDKANKPKKRRNFRETSWHQCQCSSSSQIPSQDDLDDYHQFLCLYKLKQNNNKIELIIYNTENETEEVKIFDTELIDAYSSITQLSNGEIFCYSSYKSGKTLIIDRNYGFRLLPSGISCTHSSTLYFDNNIYCFGGFDIYGISFALSKKFDLENNRWVDLALFPAAEYSCHSMIFNRNILISGYRGKNIWLYSIEIDSFSIILYDFASNKRKLLINVERLYLIEWDFNGLIYEGEDEYNWKPISKTGALSQFYDPMYYLYNKEKIYISRGIFYYKFDLKEKVLLDIK